MAYQLKPAVKNTLSILIALLVLALGAYAAKSFVNGENTQTQEIISVEHSVAGIEAKLNQPTATPEATLVPTKALLKSFKAVK